MIHGKDKRAIIAFALLLLAATGIVWAIADASRSPYRHLNYDRYITVCLPDMPQIESTDVTEEEVKAEMRRRLNSSASEETVKGEVKDGDTVIVSWYGTINEEPFDGSSASERKLTIGSESIPAFEDAVRGERTGETVKATIDYPADYSDGQLAGQTADYEICIEGIHRLKKRKYTEEYEQRIRKELLAKKQDKRERLAADIYWARLLSDAEMKEYPEELVKEEAHNGLDLHKAFAKAHGMSWKAYLEDYLNTDERSFNRMMTNQARQTVKEKVLTYKLAEENGIRLTGREYREWMKDRLAEAGRTEESIARDYGIPFSEYEKKMDLRTKALTDKLKEELPAILENNETGREEQ